MPAELRAWVEAAKWTFAKTYAETWPHEYIVRRSENDAEIVALARHIFAHGTPGRFYTQVRPYHHEAGKVYWSMDDTPESTTLVNRCDASQTYEARLAAGTLPGSSTPTESTERNMSSSLLAHLTASDPQKENLATAALAFIVNQSPSARSALRALIVEAVGNVPAIARVASQRNDTEASRPDLTLLGDGGERVGFVEVKFWAGLTEAQPVEYVRGLAKDPAGILVFLVPDRRTTTLRWELLERLRAAGMIASDAPTASTIVAEGVRVGMVVWSKVMQALEAAVRGDAAASSDVHQLRGLVEQFEGEAFIPLAREDLGDLEVPRRIIALTGLAWEIVDAACAANLLSVKGLKVTARDYGGGRYAKFEQAGCWVGLDHMMWRRTGRSPLWIDFSESDWGRADKLREPLGAWLNADPPRAFKENDSMKVPLLLAVGVEKARMVEDAVRQIRELAALLKGAGLSAV